MATRRVLLVPLLVLLLAAAPTAGGAAVGEIAPPYEQSFTDHGCSGTPSLGSCATGATTDVATGRLTSDLFMESLDGGTRPGTGYAYSVNVVATGHRIRRQARALTYTVTVDVDHFEAAYDGTLNLGRVGGVLSASASHESCSCFAGAAHVFDEGQPNDEQITLRFVMRNVEGSPIPPGRIGVTIDLWAEATFGSFFVGLPEVGRATFSLDATVSSVHVERGAAPVEEPPA